MDRAAPRSFQLRLPAWLERLLAETEPAPSADQRMAIVIELARRNVAERTGGPFGAAVFELASGRLLAGGVNLVESSGCSAAHAEIVALSLAQAAAAHWNLAQGGARRVLVSSVEPCAMCLGALPWAGLAAVECGASAADAQAIGFDEGDKPAEWEAKLRARGIALSLGIRRDQAAAVLREYALRGGAIYQPRSGG